MPVCFSPFHTLLSAMHVAREFNPEDNDAQAVSLLY
jgi:hypothetical protein